MYEYFSFIPDIDWEEYTPYIQMNHHTETLTVPRESMPAEVYNSESEI